MESFFFFYLHRQIGSRRRERVASAQLPAAVGAGAPRATQGSAGTSPVASTVLERAAARLEHGAAVLALSAALPRARERHCHTTQSARI